METVGLILITRMKQTVCQTKDKRPRETTNDQGLEMLKIKSLAHAIQIFIFDIDREANVPSGIRKSTKCQKKKRGTKLFPRLVGIDHATSLAANMHLDRNH